MQLLLEQQRVRAEIDELPPCDDAGDDLLDLLMQQRLAARDGHDGRAAFVDRRKTLRNTQPPVQNGVGIVDLAAAGAGQVATAQRIEHEDERMDRKSGVEGKGGEGRVEPGGYRSI